MKKNYIVTDLGPGDGGKGGVVHKISRLCQAHTILKVGGAQGSHGVSTVVGERFAFSQFGCGTFEGVRTHLTPRFVAMPEAILNEADDLRYRHSMHNVFDLLTVDEAVVCATPYHKIASRLKELARRDQPRGTIGTGVGEAYRYAEKCPELTICARHLLSTDLRDRLAAVRAKLQEDLLPLVESEFLPEDQLLAEEGIDRLSDPGFLDYVVQRFQTAGRRIRVVDRDYFQDEILAKDGVIVTESSHGVLTDCFMGFHPHTSALQTLPYLASNMLDDFWYMGETIVVGVTRAYAIRHGAGPLPTNDLAMAEQLLPGSCKLENRYQGKARVGPLDLVLLHYAIEACGGPKTFDALAVTWFDQVQSNGGWDLCERYQNPDPHFFTPEGAIKVRRGRRSE